METNKTENTIVLKIFNDSIEAGFVQNKLSEEGIESFLLDENAIGLNPLGGIELKIFAHDLEKAKEILSR